VKVFISWSGAISHQVALSLRDWLPSVLQAVEPYVSSEDIDKGARWSTDISQELEDSTFGIICVTPDNLQAPWVNFEAGALSKSLERSRVAPLLFGVDRTAVQGPLVQFQSTLAQHDDMQKLVGSLNSACDPARLDDARLDATFEVWWPHLEKQLASIAVKPSKSQTPQRDTDDVLAEVLELVRGQQKLLATPEQLLPPRYISWALREADPGSLSTGDPVFRLLAGAWHQLERALGDYPGTPPEVAQAIARLERPIRTINLWTRRSRTVRRARPREGTGEIPDSLRALTRRRVRDEAPDIVREEVPEIVRQEAPEIVREEVPRIIREEAPELIREQTDAETTDPDTLE
jgi:hypothetical protein